ncbi:MAG: MFS transporter [Candidatus Peregrinibacteria bacterium]|nr:MFS transporter [Candidatus Peregrinibacteria bacterium]
MKFPKSVMRWAYYDFANSAYYLIYPSFLLPVFFSTVLLTHGYSLSAWGFANAVATLIGVLLAVFIGKFSDKTSKFHSFKWSIIISFFGMVALSFAVKYALGYVYSLYIFTHAIFILALSLADSILPHVSTKENSYEYGGFAWGFGYVGGIFALIIAVIFQKLTGDDYSPIVFLSTAIFYIIFSAYSLHGLKGVQLNEAPPLVKKVSISKFNKFLLFLGYWFISEGVTVIFLFMGIYLSKEFGFSNMKIGACLLLVQLIGFPATWYGGYLTKKFSVITLLGWTILLWGISIFFLVVNVGMIGLAILIFTGALAIGNSQSYLRSQYSNIIEPSESGFQFGLFSIVSKAAVFIGPILYGYGSDYFNSQKIPLIILYITMVIGFVLIWRAVRRISVK